jgi:hypothetical protein
VRNNSKVYQKVLDDDKKLVVNGIDPGVISTAYMESLDSSSILHSINRYQLLQQQNDSLVTTPV